MKHGLAQDGVHLPTKPECFKTKGRSSHELIVISLQAECLPLLDVVLRFANSTTVEPNLI